MLNAIVILCTISAVVVWYLYWSVRPQRRLPGNRVRYTKLRLHLRMHPGRGFATLVELWLFWSKTAMLRHSKRARRDLSFWQRLRHPKEHSVFIGRAHWRHALRILAELHTLILSPPRMGKTAWLARIILRYPGPLACTSIKDDLFRYTSGIRARKGRIHVFNPQNIGEIPSTFAINVVAGCHVKETAIRRAQTLVNAVDYSKMKDGDWFKDKAAQVLEALLYAAALMNGDLRVISNWVRFSTEDAQDTLRADNSVEMAGALFELERSPAEKSTATVRMCLTQILGFMSDPAVAASVLPMEGLGFDPWAFVTSRDTLYLITNSDQDQSPLAPLFALILSEIKHEATMIAQESRKGRLRRPLGFLLDEIKQCAPVPVDKWLASVGGLGLQIFTVVHDVAQLRSRWGDNGGQIILDTCGVKMILPGVQDDRTLESLEKICGKVSFSQRGQQHKTEHAVIEAGTIRQLPDKFGLVVASNKAPVIARLPRVWNAWAYRWARLTGHDVAQVLGVREQQRKQVLEQSELAPALPADVPSTSGNGHKASYPWADRLWPATRRRATRPT